VKRHKDPRFQELWNQIKLDTAPLVIIDGLPLIGKSSFLDWLHAEVNKGHETYSAGLVTPDEVGKGGVKGKIQDVFLHQPEGKKPLILLKHFSQQRDRDDIWEFTRLRETPCRFVLEGRSEWKHWVQTNYENKPEHVQVYFLPLFDSQESELFFRAKQGVPNWAAESYQLTAGHPRFLQLLAEWTFEGQPTARRTWLQESRWHEFGLLGERLWQQFEPCLKGLDPSEEYNDGDVKRSLHKQVLATKPSIVKDDIFKCGMFVDWLEIQAGTGGKPGRGTRVGTSETPEPQSELGAPAPDDAPQALPPEPIFDDSPIPPARKPDADRQEEKQGAIGAIGAEEPAPSKKTYDLPTGSGPGLPAKAAVEPSMTVENAPTPSTAPGTEGGEVADSTKKTATHDAVDTETEATVGISKAAQAGPRAEKDERVKHKKKMGSAAKGSRGPVDHRRTLLAAQALCIKDAFGNSILNNFSLNVRSGDIILLMGESGSGKTTFLRLCMGLLPEGMQVEGLLTVPEEDSMVSLIQGRAMQWNRFRRLAGRTFGYCPQNPYSSFDARQRLDDQLWEEYRLKQCRKFTDTVEPPESITMVTHWLATLALLPPKRRRSLQRRTLRRHFEHGLDKTRTPLRDLESRPGQRSYGFMQRLGMHGHEGLSILFMDEPFNGIDPVARDHLVERCIDLIRGDGAKALVIATHDAGLEDLFRAEVDRHDLAFSVETARIDSARQTGGEPGPAVEAPKPTGKELPEPIRIGPLHSPGRSLKLCHPKFYWKSGQMIGIIGSSNSGKTTFGRHFCGWDGGGGLKEGRHYVPQSPYSCFSPGLPVREAIPVTELRSLLHEVLPDRWGEIKGLLDHPPGCLSGGQLQRLRILAAVAQEPDVLFLDEPFAHQDPEWTRDLAAALSKAMHPGKRGPWVQTMMIVSHDVNRLLKICNRMILLGEFDLRNDTSTAVETRVLFDDEVNPRIRGDFRTKLHMVRQETKWAKELSTDNKKIVQIEKAAQDRVLNFVDDLIETLPQG